MTEIIKNNPVILSLTLITIVGFFFGNDQGILLWILYGIYKFITSD